MSSKSVTFATSATMRLALHINEYTTEEIDASYYSSEDFRAFKQDVKRTACMIDMKQKIDDTISCCRGVEAFTKKASTSRSKKRRAALLAVLKEQELQLEEGMICYDRRRIATIYSKLVCESTTAAYLIGLADEMIAMEQNGLEKGQGRSNFSCQLLQLRSRYTGYRVNQSSREPVTCKAA